MLKVSEDIRLVYVSRFPVSFLQKLSIKRVTVKIGLSIGERAGIAVSVPGATDSSCLIENADVEAEVVAEFS